MKEYKPIIMDAIYALHPTAKFNMINGDDWEHVEWKDKNIAEPSQSDVETKLASMVSDWEGQEYARNRELEYPTVQELVVALYDEDDKAAIDAKRAEIKAKYPKP